MKKLFKRKMFPAIILLMFASLFMLVACNKSDVVTKIEIKTPATKLTFAYGEEFSSDGLVIEKVKSDGTKEDIEASEYRLDLGGYNKETPKTYTITITLKSDVTKTTTYDVTVEEEVVLDFEIKIKTPATKLTFAYGEEFSSEGLAIEKVKSDDTKEDLEASEYTLDLGGYNKEVAKTYTITITLKSDVTKTTTYDVVVEEETNKLIFEKVVGEDSYKLISLSNVFNLTTVVVPNTYNNLPVSQIAEGVFSNNADILELSLPFAVNLKDLFGEEILVGLKKLTITGGSEFPNIDNSKIEELVIASLELVNIPNGVVEWNNTIRLVDLSGSKNLETIGKNFNNCLNLEQVLLTNLSKLTSIGASFSGVYGTGGNHQSRLYNIDFTGCTSLESIGAPTSSSDQGGMSFQYLPNLLSINLSDTIINTLYRQNFYYVENLQEIILPASLSSIGYDFLAGANKLEEIIVSPGNLWFEAVEGILYEIDEEGNLVTLIKAPANGKVTNYVAPKELKTIKTYGFQNAKNFVSIDLTAAKLEEIGGQAFAGCENAVLKVPFDGNSFYQDGTKIANLGGNWNRNVQETIYAEEYKELIILVEGIIDKMLTANKTVTFTTTATYGEVDANIEVKLNDSTKNILKDGNSYTLTLTEGENIVVVIASFGEEPLITKSQTYKITYEEVLVDPEAIVEGLVDNSKYDEAGVIEFSVSFYDANGHKVDLTLDNVTVTTDWGYDYRDVIGLESNIVQGVIYYSFKPSDSMSYEWGDGYINWKIIVTVGEFSKTFTFNTTPEN